MLHDHKKHSFWDRVTSFVTREDLSVIEICHEDNFRLSVAALLIIVATSDKDFVEEEHQLIKTLLVEEFDLPNKAVEELIANAQNEAEDAIDLYGFIRIINKNLDQEGRQDIVRLLWRIVFADRKIKHLEDNMMNKLCHLLGVSKSDSVAIKNEIYEEI